MKTVMLLKDNLPSALINISGGLIFSLASYI